MSNANTSPNVLEFLCLGLSKKALQKLRAEWEAVTSFTAPLLLPARFRGKEQQVKLGTGAQLQTLALLPAPASLCKLFLCLFFCQRDANAASLASLKSMRTHCHHLCRSSQRGDGCCKSISGPASAAEGVWLDWFCACSPGPAAVHGPAALTSLLPGLNCKKDTSLIWARSLLGKSCRCSFFPSEDFGKAGLEALAACLSIPDLFNNNLIHLTQSLSGLAGVTASQPMTAVILHPFVQLLLCCLTDKPSWHCGCNKQAQPFAGAFSFCHPKLLCPVMHPCTPQWWLWKGMQKSWCLSCSSLPSFLCSSVLTVSYSGMKEKSQIAGFGYLDIGGVCWSVSLGCPQSHMYKAGSIPWNFIARL